MEYLRVPDQHLRLPPQEEHPVIVVKPAAVKDRLPGIDQAEDAAGTLVDVRFGNGEAVGLLRPDAVGAAAKQACENNVVTPALDAIIEANVYLSGVGADNGGLAVAHSFYNGLTALGGHSAPHGSCVAFGTLVQLVLEGAPKEEFKEVQDFCLEVGLPIRLEEIGITTDEEIRTIAEKACVEGESIHNMVADVTPAELYDAIVAADALGKARL